MHVLCYVTILLLFRINSYDVKITELYSIEQGGKIN
jgi:hypothetical protein